MHPGTDDLGPRDDPTDIAAHEWKAILDRTRIEAKRDRAPLLAAAVAFYALLALVPAIVATISVYGLFADPSTVERQASDWLGAAPQEVRDLVVTQLQAVTERTGTAIGLSAALGIVVALWSASSGVGHLIEAINVAYDVEDRRGFVRRKGLALLFAIGAVVFVLVAVALIAVLPAAVADTGLGTAGRVAVGVLRWALLLLGMLLALAVLYRFGPDRADPQWRWITPGAVVATLLWLLVSALFAVYTANFGRYDETYGSLGAVVVVMLWLFLTALCVVLGAELNAETEREVGAAPDTAAGDTSLVGGSMEDDLAR